MVVNSPISSDDNSDDEKEPAAASADKFDGSDGDGSPVYGPQRSRFDSESASKFGLMELEVTPEPPSPPHEEEMPMEYDDEKKDTDDSGLPPYYPGIDGEICILIMGFIQNFIYRFLDAIYANFVVVSLID